jgi:uncharacterized protein YeaO (DUF488 family)
MGSAGQSPALAKMPHMPRKKLKISIKRAYEDPAPEDGYRVLVDRMWPRGRSKAELKLEQWARDLAPGPELRKWFGHDPERWDVFRQRYLRELGTPEQQERIRHLLAEAGGHPITLVYGAKDEEHNHALVLQQLLSQQQQH